MRSLCRDCLSDHDATGPLRRCPACGSPRLMALFEQLYAETQRYRLPIFRGDGPTASGRDLSAEHSQIMEAALARQADMAVRLLQIHYHRTAEDIAGSAP